MDYSSRLKSCGKCVYLHIPNKQTPCSLCTNIKYAEYMKAGYSEEQLMEHDFFIEEEK